MKRLLLAVASLLVIGQAFAAKPTDSAKPKASKPRTIRVPNGPTILNLRDFPLAHFRMSISPKLYKSLIISPLTAWVVAQVPVMPASEPKISRSDAGGAYDKLALEMAKGWGGTGFNSIESRTHHPTLNVHLLIYRIADGIMAVNFAHNDEAFYAGPQQSDVWVGVCKNGKWARIGGTKITREYSPYY